MFQRHRVTLLLVAVAALVLAVGYGAAATKAAPTNTAEPQITGTPVVGKRLTATSGQWTGSPTFSLQWVRCDTTGWRAGRLRLRRDQRCHDTGLRSGQRRCGQAVAHPRVTAKNADGSKTVASNATKAIREASQPTNSTPPTITGAAKVGSTLTAHRGTWSGDNLKYSYAWRRCDQDGGSCSTITGATDTTYLLKTTDKGNTIRVRVRAENADGSDTATSTPTAVVGDATAPAPVNGCPAGTGAISIGQVGTPARLSIDAQRISPSIVRGNTQSVTIRLHVSACGGRSSGGRARLRHRRALQPVLDPERAAHRLRRMGDPSHEPTQRVPGDRQAAAAGRLRDAPARPVSPSSAEFRPAG